MFVLRGNVSLSTTTGTRRPIAGSAWAVRQIAVYEKCVEASFLPFCDLALQVGRGLVPHQPCFGVLTAGTRESTRSPRFCPLEAGKAERNGSWDAQVSTPKRIRRGQPPNGWAIDSRAQERETFDKLG